MSFFEDQVRAWSNPPIDDVGYIHSEVMLSWPDAHLIDTINQMNFTRYSAESWRNWGNGWREGLRLDGSMQGQIVLDFGCGVGMESLEIASLGNYVIMADISSANLAIATRIMELYDQRTWSTMLVGPEFPFMPNVNIDVIHCAGVLHHIPYADQVMRRFAELLKPGGEVHLMLYSDRGWRNFIGTEPPEDVTTDPNFGNFVLTFDQVGSYADWYDEQKVARLAGDAFDLVEFRYITVDDRYCTAVLVKR